MLWYNFGRHLLSLAALLVIVSCGGGEQRRGTDSSSSTGGSSSSSSSSSGGSSNSNYSNRRFHKIQHGQCTYTFILPEGDGGRGGSCREAKAGSPQNNGNTLQRDAPPPEPEFPSQKIQQLEHIMENYTQWLQKVRRVVWSFDAMLTKLTCRVDQESFLILTTWIILWEVLAFGLLFDISFSKWEIEVVPDEMVDHESHLQQPCMRTDCFFWSGHAVVYLLRYLCFCGCVWSPPSVCLWLHKITCFGFSMRLSDSSQAVFAVFSLSTHCLSQCLSEGEFMCFENFCLGDAVWAISNWDAPMSLKTCTRRRVSGKY